MKPKVVYLLLLCSCLSLNLFAQKQPLPTDLGAKVMLNNYGYTNQMDSLRITNGIEVFFSKYITPRLSIGVPLRIGVSHLPEVKNNVNTISLDGQFQFHLADYDAQLSPYLLLGGGIVLENFENNNVQIPGGAGLHVRLAPNSFLTLQGEYRYGLTQESRNNVQVGIGYTYRLGSTKKDTDGDGVPDELDECPEKVGTPELAGCPDTDGDGIADMADACPRLPGVELLLGCPDADGDGITDKEDDCPDDPGFSSTNGCPDEDRDDVADIKDECPDEKGTAKGCPDSDGDGVADKDDACPDEKGTFLTNGCPTQLVDSDEDGITDEEDDCPERIGVASANGCPDADGDGIKDDIDSCPNEAGIASRQGCPEPSKVQAKKDSDGDGIVDEEDDCPSEIGTVANNGCPENKIIDTDGDGLADEEDSCPEEAGTLANYGCPETGTAPIDSDGDGVADDFDDCPNAAGTPDNNGCPPSTTTNAEPPTTPTSILRVTDDEEKFLAELAQNIQFEPASPVLKAASYRLLDQVAAIMNRYPSANLLIEGHTDDVGRTAANQLLSEQRAIACKEYLSTRDVDRNRMTAIGHGELRPMASNASREGKKMNRRVEFKLSN